MMHMAIDTRFLVLGVGVIFGAALAGLLIICDVIYRRVRKW